MAYIYTDTRPAIDIGVTKGNLQGYVGEVTDIGADGYFVIWNFRRAGYPTNEIGPYGPYYEGSHHHITFSMPRTNLRPNTSYEFEFFTRLFDDSQRWYGGWLNFTTGTPVVQTKPATDILFDGAKLQGHYETDYLGYLTYRFEWKKGVSGTVYSWQYQFASGDGPKDKSRTITGLDPSSIYYFRFSIKFHSLPDPVWFCGSWLGFTTQFAAAVNTNPATNVQNLNGQINGEVISGQDEIVERGFQWYAVIYPGVFLYPFDVNVAEDKIKLISEDISTGSRIRFKTTNLLPKGLEPCKTYYAIRIDSETIKVASTLFNANAGIAIDLIDDGLGTHQVRFIDKGEASSPNEVVVGSGPGEFNEVIGTLVVDRLRYFRAYGKGDSGTYYFGEWLHFTTTCIVPTGSTQIATDIDPLSVTGNGTIIDIGGGEPYCDKRGFEITYNFSGTLEEYEAWKGHGFTGDVTLNSGTGLWEGTLTKLYEESGVFPTIAFALGLDDLICNKEYSYRARAKNTAGWGHGSYLAFTTSDLLKRKSCTCGIFTIMLCAYVKPIPSGSIIKRRGFRWGGLISAQEYDIHEDGNFSASATIGPVDTISFVNSADDTVYDTIVDSSGGFLTAGFEEGKFIDVSATGAIDPANEGQFRIISVTADTITVNIRNTLVSEAVTGVTIVELYALYIVDLDPETIYYSVAYVAIEDNLGVWTMQEGNVTGTTTIANIFDFEGYDKVEFYKPEREQNYKKITRKIEAEIIAEQEYIERVGGRRVLDIPNHLIQTKDNAIEIGTSYKERFKNIKSLMGIEYPTPAPFQREDTLDFGFGRIRFKEDDKGVVNFMPDGEGLMLFRYRMIMIIRKINMGQSFSEDSVDYLATMELEEA